jgi:hypothetical protein
VPMHEDNAAGAPGTALTGDDRHWLHNHVVGTVTGGGRPNGVRGRD